ncbi:MAG: PAS domain-containing protein [Myxococcales bacterium]|nr:PAS domain-containing protein [Myxococcales bacterium]
MDVAVGPAEVRSLELTALRSSITAGVVVEDRHGKLAIANPAAERLLGPYLTATPCWSEAPRGWRLTNLDDVVVPIEELAPRLARVQRAPVRGQLVVVRPPDGATTWLELDAEPILGADGAVDTLVVTIVDRTSVMGLIRELTDSRRQLAEVMDASHDGFFARDFITGRTLHSARMNALVGLPAVDTEAGLDDWRRRIHPDDAARLEQAYAAVTAGQLARFDLTYRVRCEDGAWRWVRSRGKLVLRTSDGAPHRLIGTVSDVQAFKDLEAALSISERRLREASTSGAVGLWELDLSTYQAWRTDRHKEIFGDGGGAWTLHDFRAAVVPEDREVADRALELGRRAGDMHFEVRIRRGDGRLRWIEVDAALALDEAGALRRMCGTVRDITERKWIELDLERAMRFKAARVTELEGLLKAGTPLSGLLTACMHCQSVRDEDGAWERLDTFVAARTGARFSHGICPTCRSRHYPDE